MRNLARDDCRTQVPFGAVVGGLDTVIAQKPQHVSPVMLRADSVQKPLIIRIGKGTISEVSRQFIVQPSFDGRIDEYLRPLFEKVYTISFDNYPVAMECLPRAEIQACKSGNE